jgi:hypothetical protein
MSAEELAQATAEFDQEFVADSFHEPTPEQKAQLQRAKRKRGRPKVGKGFKAISVSIERGLLEKTDRLAKRTGLHRSHLIAQGLEAIVTDQIRLHR